MPVHHFSTWDDCRTGMSLAFFQALVSTSIVSTSIVSAKYNPGLVMDYFCEMNKSFPFLSRSQRLHLKNKRFGLGHSLMSLKCYSLLLSAQPAHAASCSAWPSEHSVGPNDGTHWPLESSISPYLWQLSPHKDAAFTSLTPEPLMW